MSMSHIPLVDRLGEAIELAITRESARPDGSVSRTGRRSSARRRVAALSGRRRLSLVLVLVALGGAAVAVAQTLQSSTALVTGGIACYAGTGTAASAYYDVEANGRPPEAACARLFRLDGPSALGARGVKLVACADPHGYVAVFKATGSSAQCRAAGMSALQAGAYASAQGSVDRLVRALTALGASRRCLDPGSLIAEVQRVLDRLGWTGWRAAREQQPGRAGSCGLFVATGSSFSDPTASLDAAHRTVWIAVGPLPSVITLTAALDRRMIQLSGEHCYTTPDALARVRAALASANVAIRFTLTQEPAGEQIAYAQGAYDRGCTIIGSLAPAPRGRTVDVWLNSKSGRSIPLGAAPSAGAFLPLPRSAMS